MEMGTVEGDRMKIRVGSQPGICRSDLTPLSGTGLIAGIGAFLGTARGGGC